jgi:hypothetical protein
LMDAQQKLFGGTGDRCKASTHAESDAEEAMTCTMLKVVRGIDELCPLEVNATVKLAAQENTVSSMVSWYTLYNSPSCKVLEAEMSGRSPSSNTRRRRRHST